MVITKNQPMLKNKNIFSELLEDIEEILHESLNPQAEYIRRHIKKWRQDHFYFGDRNLYRDKFLNSQIEKNPEKFPLETTMDDLLEFMTDFGPFLDLRMKKQKKKFVGSIFCVFKQLETAQKFVDLQQVLFRDVPLSRIYLFVQICLSV
ncbi:uncharacterized protein LOC115227199 [Octopus sinensis]|uniref:Uncharacterized protein LOC115227199 n=1 Tax=Octopus sinensis TaxID=2607531 RepID=A0A6P7TQF3_9MOLL|nr:uncharacterized protein LOC115227199 [Octopus sinensis]